jgi:hypothetical protein
MGILAKKRVEAQNNLDINCCETQQPKERHNTSSNPTAHKMGNIRIQIVVNLMDRQRRLAVPRRIQDALVA